MKTIFKTVLAVSLLTLFFACNKEDDSNNDSPLGTVAFVYDVVTNFTGAPGDNIITLEVDMDAIVVDPAKVFIELNLEYPYAEALDYAYSMPSDNGEFKYMVGALGGDNQYVPENTLRFNPNHTDVIEHNYPDGIIPSGDYVSDTSDAFSYPVESPLFVGMTGKSIRGDWKFNFPAYANFPGKVYKINLRFEEGALELE